MAIALLLFVWYLCMMHNTVAKCFALICSGPKDSSSSGSPTTTPTTPTTPGGSKLSPGNIFKNFFKCVAVCSVCQCMFCSNQKFYFASYLASCKSCLLLLDFNLIFYETLLLLNHWCGMELMWNVSLPNLKKKQKTN